MVLVGEYVTRMVPMGTHEWRQYINPEDLEAMLRPGQVTARAGLMVSNPLTLEMAEYPNWLRGNYMLMAKRVV